MGFAYATIAASGGSGPTETLRWAFDTLEQTAPFTAGSLNIVLSQTPVDADGIFLTSAGAPCFPPDYTFIAPNQITIEFSGDPATDAPGGVWVFHVQYQYSV